jgi:hypothetical protein
VAQMSLFGPSENGPRAKPISDQTVSLRVLITVKAAPNPSETYGETVCVAGLSVDLQRHGWIRLYPINFRALASDDRFRKYDIVSVDAKPARQDQRRESWRPIMDTLVNERHLPPWNPRKAWLDPYIEDSMCRLNRDAKTNPNAQSLALIHVQDVSGIVIEPHPGWTKEELRKIDAYVNQLDLLSDQDRTPLEAPRFRASYRYRCHDRQCAGHRQGILDWELVALQRHLTGLPDEQARQTIKSKFLDQMFAASRDVALYVGNQAKRPHVFSVLGVYWPKR